MKSRKQRVITSLRQTWLGLLGLLVCQKDCLRALAALGQNLQLCSSNSTTPAFYSEGRAVGYFSSGMLAKKKICSNYFVVMDLRTKELHSRSSNSREKDTWKTHTRVIWTQGAEGTGHVNKEQGQAVGPWWGLHTSFSLSIDSYNVQF